MNTQDRKKCLRLIASPKVSERRSAVRAMWKSREPEFAPVILESLKNENLQDASMWQSKCLMIAALGDLGFAPARPFLERLVAMDFRSAPLIYAELAFALCRLHGIKSGHLDFVRQALKSRKPLFAKGVFHAIYFMDLDLQEKEVVPLIGFALRYSKAHPDDEQLSCMPRDYLAAAAYRWQGKKVRAFLHECQSREFPHVREIATSSLEGVRSSDSRLAWYK